MFELSVIAYRWLCLLSFCLFLKFIMAFCPFFDWLTFVPVSFYTFQWLLGTHLFFFTGSIISLIHVFHFFFYIPPGHLLLPQYALMCFWPAEQCLPGDTWGQSPYFLEFESPSWWTCLSWRSTLSVGAAEGKVVAGLGVAVSLIMHFQSALLGRYAWHTALLLRSLFTLVLESPYTSLQGNWTSVGIKTTWPKHHTISNSKWIMGFKCKTFRIKYRKYSGPRARWRVLTHG